MGSFENIYTKKPLDFQMGIPIFSEKDEYLLNYEKISQHHIEAMRGGKNNPWIEERIWKEMENSTAKLIRKYAKTGCRILDVGVGLGRLLKHFPDLERYGIDVSIPYLIQAQKEGIDVCCSRVEDMPYQREVFDVIVCTDVLEHVLDLNLAVEKIFFALKEGGILIVRVPYREDLSRYLAFDYPYQFAHLRSFDEHSLVLTFGKIFDSEVVEKSFQLFLPSAYKLKYKLPWGNRVIVWLISKSNRISNRLYRNINERLFDPTEIEVVLRKK